MLKLMHMNTLPKSRSLKQKLHLLGLPLVPLLLSSWVIADDDGQAGQNSRSVHVLNNLQLVARADELRSTDMPMVQRSLNYQWLDNHQHENAVLDGKALSTLGNRMFGKYIEEQRDYYFGDGRYTSSGKKRNRFSDIDYKVRFSSNQFRIGLKYQF